MNGSLPSASLVPLQAAARPPDMRTEVARHRALLAGRRGFRAKVVRARAAEKVAELYVYDAIGADYWGGVSPKDVAAALDAARDDGAKKLRVYINSPGGDVFDGVAIFNLIRRFDGERTVYVDGLAASAASLIAMAGDRIVIAPNAMIMIHDPWTIALGNAADMRKTADTLDQIAGTLVDTYVKRTDQKAEDVKAWMADETWMDAATAIERRFADEASENEMGCDCEGECGDDCPCGGACTDECECDCESAEREEDESAAAAAGARLLNRYQKTPPAVREQAASDRARRARLASLEERTKTFRRASPAATQRPGQPGR